MKIVADENLALTDYFFADIGEIHNVAGRHLKHQDVQDAELLLVRSVTQVNAALIENTALKFVGSATIGTDHLDQAALAEQHIVWSNAAGCNAQAVAEYVVTAIFHLEPILFEKNKPFCLGIVGLGNVGKRLAHLAGVLGWQVIAYDPYVVHDTVEQVDLEQLLQQADAVSLHVPLTRHDEHATYHLMNAKTLSLMPKHSILINAARGAVVEEAALITDIEQTGRRVVLDVFEHEPVISSKLLQLLRLATPHIAGYSLEGKARGTQMIYEAYCKAFDLPQSKDFKTQLAAAEQYFQDQDIYSVLKQQLNSIYNIAQDDAALRACLHDGIVDQEAFDRLRKQYPLRREWAAHGGPCHD
ncbi:4-phosphoerythronate dehydrogenase [Acinetobacter rudis]|uniref:Erythronate-4-phosphate dehydrogenase n=1 Tax=Acinetobacter rudis TaxID=632955 RepID=A0AAW8JDE6_9GAMM|nr:4-phosphoerythronate dehydrogenase [Acinetobacter rudis]MDQ8935694.1 4-phosphoerythronate dehydrogenase [Acinetobacter rudis]MDQ8952034.1 4-phosphoerythronate dehydrogenase [Acinetobacter rudis]MDQ9017957.1 4-phosphoerythronate dehydrogenase [Acinetobacter rudis]